MNANQNQLVPWGPEKKLKWFVSQRVQRSYHDDVLVRIEALRIAARPGVVIEGYGSLTLDPERFPLFAIRLGDWSKPNPTILITGGVHGYETSGVKGALSFVETLAANYFDRFRFVVAPCVSPWSYETVNRLNPIMENPNREFKPEGKAEECRLLMAYLAKLGVDFDAHLDLHETTDSDKGFIPEEYAKNGKFIAPEEVTIPDGFFLIGTTGAVHVELERAMIESVRKVTHIAVADERGMIGDDPKTHDGVVHGSIPGLCAEYTTAKGRWGAYTTEMYPDSPRFKAQGQAAVEALCSSVQVACLRGALDFWAKA